MTHATFEELFSAIFTPSERAFLMAHEDFRHAVARAETREQQFALTRQGTELLLSGGYQPPRRQGD